MIQLLLTKLMGKLAKNRLLLSAIFVSVGLIGILGLFLFEEFDHNFKDFANRLSVFDSVKKRKLAIKNL